MPAIATPTTNTPASPDLAEWKNYLPEAAMLESAASPETEEEPEPEAETLTEEATTTTPETEEVPEETTAETTPETDEEPEVIQDIPKAIREMGKRIDKLTAQKKTTEELLASREAEIAELRQKLSAQPSVESPAAKAESATPLDDIDTPEALNEFRASAIKIRRWALENMDGAEIELAGGEKKYLDSAEVRRIFSRADADLTEALPAREKAINERIKSEEELKKLLPAAFDPNHDIGKAYAKLKKEFAPLRNHPFYATFALDALVGAAHRLQAQQKAVVPGKPATATVGTPKLARPAPHVPSGTAPARVPASQKLRETATRKVLDTGGDMDSLTGYFQSAGA